MIDRTPKNNSPNTSLKKARRLDTLRKRIAQYAYVLTNKHIPVKFNVSESHKDPWNPSYTDGDIIVVGGTDRKEDVPVIIGTALHEGSHIAQTDFDVWFYTIENPVMSMTSRAKKLIDEMGMKEKHVQSILKNVFNVIEDRYIDTWAMKERPGFRKYYAAMYKALWNSKDVSECVEKGVHENDNPAVPDIDLTEETVHAYLYMVTNISNDTVQKKGPNMLNGFQEILDTLDYPRVLRLSETEDRLDVSTKIIEIILENVDDPAHDDESEFEDINEQMEQFQNAMSDEEGQKYKIVVHMGEESEHGDSNAMTVESFEEMMDEMDIEIDPDVQKYLDALKNGNVEVTSDDMGIPNVKVFHYRITDIDSESFEHYSDYESTNTTQAVEEGRVRGKQLANLIRVRNDINVRTKTRQRRGKLAGNLLSEIGYNERVFKSHTVEEYGDVWFYISIDGSYSMSGERWHNAISAAVSLMVAFQHIDNVNLTVNVRYSEYENPAIVTVYEDGMNVNTALNDLKRLDAGGSTPEALCFDSQIDHIINTAGSVEDAYFINFSDGEPYFTSNEVHYSGNTAIEHTQRLMRLFDREKINVMSYFIGNGSSEFERMYGTNAKIIDVQNIPELARSINKSIV